MRKSRAQVMQYQRCSDDEAVLHVVIDQAYRDRFVAMAVAQRRAVRRVAGEMLMDALDLQDEMEKRKK